MKDKEYNGVLYEYGEECPVCGNEFYYESDEADHITKPIRFYNGSNDCFRFEVFITCKKCGKNIILKMEINKE